MNGVPVPNIPPITVEVDGVYNLLPTWTPTKYQVQIISLKETAQQMAPLLTITFQASLQ